VAKLIDHPPQASRARAAWLRRYGLVLALGLVCALLAAAKPTFFTAANLVNILRQVSINGLLAVGVTLVLLTGGVDLSLGSVVALSGVVAASLAQPGDGPVLFAVAAGIGAGLACGLVNGALVAYGRVAPFIATLGMMTAARGLALVWSGGRPVSNLVPGFTALGGDWGRLPIPALLLAAVTLAVWVFLNRTRWGRHLYAVGSSAAAARAAGISVTGIRLFAYSLCGALAGLAGVVLAARITTGQPNAGIAYELDAIAAVVIGGTSLSDGVGGVGGTILGVLLLGVINSGLDQLNVSAYYQQIIKGAIIVGAVWLDQRSRRES
jgi:inositol transport system permease protein